MSEYIGLARKWRPKSFEDLVGQNHISRTLSNAIQSGRIGQGYVFTGTRGVGKTSAARIFAKAIRCPNPPKPGSSCNTCRDCLEIAEGRSVDVLEIDGASNNGVDSIREIRENAKYLPSNGKYKIYIIDEVHMLTTAAFNALLKTLEEPPAHVVFIFATTDPQKIPATVLSRCQRFDFKRISQKELQERLQKICETEGLSIGKDALSLLSREAEGSMRDGISLLDQVLGVAQGKPLDATGITQALGLVDKQTILDCVTGILKREPLLALEAVGRVHLHGFDLKQFGREVLRYLRMVMVSKLLQQHGTDASVYLDVSDVDLQDVSKLIDLRSSEDLDVLFRILNHGLEDVARSQIPRTVMDVLVLKMATGEELVALSDLASPKDFGETEKPRVAAPAPATPAPTPVKASPTVTAPIPALKPTPTAAPAVAPSELNLAWWQGVVSRVAAEKPYLGTILEHMGFHSAARESSGIVVSLSVSKENSFYRDQLKTPANADQIAQFLKKHLGCAARLDYKDALEASSSPLSLAQIDVAQKKSHEEEMRRAILDSEPMRATQQLLGARLERLDLTETPRK